MRPLLKPILTTLVVLLVVLVVLVSGLWILIPKPPSDELLREQFPTIRGELEAVLPDSLGEHRSVQKPESLRRLGLQGITLGNGEAHFEMYRNVHWDIARGYLFAPDSDGLRIVERTDVQRAGSVRYVTPLVDDWYLYD